MTIEYVDVDLAAAPSPAKHNPKLLPVQTVGKVYDLSKRSAGEIEGEKARWAAESQARKSKAAEAPEKPVDTRAETDIRRLIDESQTSPENLLGINVKAFGIDVSALRYGNVSTKVDGYTVKLPDGGPKVTVNSKGEITAVKYRGAQITQDGRGILKYEVCGVNVTAAVDAAKALKMGAGAVTKAVVESRVGQAGDQYRVGSTERVEAQLKKDVP
jgi:hypothetical protein